MAADIYWEFVWTANGLVHRIAHVCVTYGISVVLVQTGICPAPGTLPAVWMNDAPSLLSIVVQDNGPDRLNVHGAPPALHNANQINHAPNAFYVVNGQMVMAKPVAWHHRVTVRPAIPGMTWHYHQHAPRINHGPPPPILPPLTGSHVEFRGIRYGTQVQNYRLALGVVTA